MADRARPPSIANEAAGVPEQELWRAVPSRSHVLGVIGVRPFGEITSETCKVKTG